MPVPESTEKPRFRGRIHQVAFLGSIPAGATLIALGSSVAARVAAAIYAVALSTLFGVSASYHRLHWSARARDRMQALDHSAIYVLIAGTYTPISLLVLEGAWRWAMLGLAWGGALAGTAIKTSRVRWGNGLGFALYLALGWAVLIAAPQIVRNLSPLLLSLLVAGGVLYTVGAILFAMRKPVLRPATFGFHEIWHAFVLSAATCHYIVVTALVATR